MTKVNKCKQTAIIFVRCSSSGYLIGRQDTSRQVSDLEAYASYSNLEVVRIFEEHISGGKKNNERPILQEAIEFCKQEKIAFCLVNSLDRIGRNAFEVLETVKDLIDNGINLYMQKEQFTLLGDDGKPTMFAPIMIATLSTCAQLERDSISFRLNSGRAQYVRNGGKLGRKKGSVKTKEQKEKEYHEVLVYLHRGYSIRATAKLTNISQATVQKLKNEFIRDAI
ncbi:recombinase family protein [Prevotella sp. P6B4]|uniref:recombinase family protein n=1 Tax=Prevotella sp. P6B4 TaxID=1410614 RepID=UPI00048B8143|nr:recombinase family protein [Prevotella sp. P6B4]